MEVGCAWKYRSPCKLEVVVAGMDWGTEKKGWITPELNVGVGGEAVRDGVGESAEDAVEEARLDEAEVVKASKEEADGPDCAVMAVGTREVDGSERGGDGGPSRD